MNTRMIAMAVFCLLLAPKTKADDLADIKDQLRVANAQVAELRKKIEEQKNEQARQQAGSESAKYVAQAAPAQSVEPLPSQITVAPEPGLAKLLDGFYGTVDVSLDVATKGMDGMQAYPFIADPSAPGGFRPDTANAKAGPAGRVGWMPELSTNKSGFGYHGDHTVGGLGDTKVVYQIEAGFAITSAPGLNTSWTQQAGVVKGGWGYGDSYVGVQRKDLGALKFGTAYSPYKKATDRFNPFSGQLGDYAVVMGNSGGDNRVEWGTRLDHSVWYESPKFSGFGFDLLWSPGQNRSYDSVIQSAGSPDCSGGNLPGSGNLPMECDDGGFQDALSAAAHFEYGGLYVVGAWEWHNLVNRNSDGIGSNNPRYGDFAAANPYGVTSPANNPLGLPGGALGGYMTDIANEYAVKAGVLYSFKSVGFTIGGIFEALRRPLPAQLMFQNERQRNGTWLFASQQLFGGLLAAGWAHATKSAGDPGGQHNYDPRPDAANNTADMFTVAYRHSIDKALTLYVDFADTMNHGNAHYDLGAGGRGLTTDCHDATNTVVVDYSGAGPTTWGGCNLVGVSSGVNYRF